MPKIIAGGEVDRASRTSRSSARCTLDDTIEQSDFVRDRGMPSVLDFPFQPAASGYAAGGSERARDARTGSQDDDYFRTPNGVDPTSPTFLGNHDMGRAA